MELKRLQELAGMVNEAADRGTSTDTVYKRVHAALQPVLVKLTKDLGGKDEEDQARELLTKAIREYMQDELVT